MTCDDLKRELAALEAQERDMRAALQTSYEVGYERGKATAHQELADGNARLAVQLVQLMKERDDARADFVARLGANTSLHQGEVQKLRERAKAWKALAREMRELWKMRGEALTALADLSNADEDKLRERNRALREALREACEALEGCCLTVGPCKHQLEDVDEWRALLAQKEEEDT